MPRPAKKAARKRVAAPIGPEADRAALEGFWAALGRADGVAMGRFYDVAATFEDPIFRLQGREIATMWRTLMDGTGDLEVATGPLQVIGATATGSWTATYTFRPTARRIVNRISTTLEAREGRLVAHRDRFRLWKWLGMALGPLGWLFGWTPMVRRRLRRLARERVFGTGKPVA